MADDENEDVVGNQNERQLSAREAIANKADALRADDLDDYLKDDEANQGEGEEEEEVEEETRPAPEKKFKLKINGQDFELTEKELIERASKVSAADQYLAESKRAYEQAQQQTQIQAKAAAPSTDAQKQPAKPYADDDLALARVIQMGSEEEAAQAIALLRRPNPSVLNTDDIAMRAVDRLRFERDSAWFQETYPEIFASDDWRGFALMLDETLVRGGDRRQYKERYKEIGDKVRGMMGTNKSLADKREAKAASAESIKQASVRSRPAVDEEEDDSASAVIARIAKSRGQVLG